MWRPCSSSTRRGSAPLPHGTHIIPFAHPSHGSQVEIDQLGLGRHPNTKTPTPRHKKTELYPLSAWLNLHVFVLSRSFVLSLVCRCRWENVEGRKERWGCGVLLRSVGSRVEELEELEGGSGVEGVGGWTGRRGGGESRRGSRKVCFCHCCCRSIRKHAGSSSQGDRHI